MPRRDSRRALDRSLESVAQHVTEYVRGQADHWRQLPGLALQREVAAASGWGPDTGLDDWDITRGFVCIATSPHGYVELFVDLASGDIVQDDLKTAPRPDQLVRAALRPDRLSAREHLAEARKWIRYHGDRTGKTALVYGTDESSQQHETWQRFAAIAGPLVEAPYTRTPGSEAISNLVGWASEHRDVWRLLPDARNEGGWVAFLHRGADAKGIEKSLGSVKGHALVRLVDSDQRQAELTHGLTSQARAVGGFGVGE